MKLFRFVLLIAFCLCLLAVNRLFGQKTSRNNNPVFVDKKGVMRWTQSKAEAAFFGINYTVPFAYGYRSHKALGVDLEKAIDQDVYHFARLGLDAFRVHVWDTEISDSIGNLLNNEHLRLFDYLIAKLKERNIKILITPIAFWGSGYPEKDEKTISWVSKYGKGPSVVNEEAIKAQEKYVQQFFEHVNPYTKLTYGNDPHVIAMEINNEPHHSGAKARTTEYVNRLAKAVRNTGWTKPVFYNISESPAYADAVAKADVDGFSFQWYPTGLVANRTLKGNYLPNVDTYHIPFRDTIPQFANKALMVYEFDAGDIFQSNMYPAMARSFRAAGFQWATQFAYDPITTAYANTEYQTHYVNLAYTPAKAISLLIASKAFHVLPRLQQYANYPADSVFGPFRVSYKQELSEMNTSEEFYYSNNTITQPLNIARLHHIAGVGNSPVVNYSGTGAYFLDKLQDGIWRLEVMPDAIHIRDPFGKASPQKTVTHIHWNQQNMGINLPGLNSDFKIEGQDQGNTYSTIAVNGSFKIKPGTYLLTTKGPAIQAVKLSFANIGLKEFVAPQNTLQEVAVVHTPFQNVTAKMPMTLRAQIVGLASNASIVAEVRNSVGKWKTLQMHRSTSNYFSVEVPGDMLSAGLINYRFIVQQGKEHTTFPGNHKGDPYAWNSTHNDIWQTYVASPQTVLELFNPDNDRGLLNMYNPDWRNYTISYTIGEKPGELIMENKIAKPVTGTPGGWQLYIADKLNERRSEVEQFNTLVVKARSATNEAATIKLSLITADGESYSTAVELTREMKEIAIPLTSLVADSNFLLPRPYPGFQKLKFKPSGSSVFKLSDADKIEVMFMPAQTNTSPLNILMETVYLKK